MMVVGAYLSVMLLQSNGMTYFVRAKILFANICRYPGAHQHRFLLGFFKRVGEYYVMHGRANDFVLDLLRINVPKLFSFSDNSDAIYSEACKKVQLEFSTFIQRYIYLNALKLNLQSRMSEILVGISTCRKSILSLLP